MLHKQTIIGTVIRTFRPDRQVIFPQSVDILRSLFERLEHLNLTDKLSTEDPVVQRADGGFGDIYSAKVWIDGKKVPVALKRIRIYVQKDKDFAKVRL